MGGVVFNIPIISVTATKDGSIENTRNFTREMGTYSSGLEHSVPEKMFTKNSQVVDAISAVKALQIANLNNQKIYTINSSNMNNILPILNLDNDSLLEIRSALNVGKDVITHPEAVSVPGWSGFGYIIVDPVIGDGAYKISGGFNGGSQEDTSEGGSNLIGSIIDSKLQNYSVQDVALIVMCVAYEVGKVLLDLLLYKGVIKNAKKKNSVIKRFVSLINNIVSRAALTLTLQVVFWAVLFAALFAIVKCVVDNAIGLNQRAFKLRCV